MPEGGCLLSRRFQGLLVREPGGLSSEARDPELVGTRARQASWRPRPPSGLGPGQSGPPGLHSGEGATGTRALVLCERTV